MTQTIKCPMCVFDMRKVKETNIYECENRYCDTTLTHIDQDYYLTIEHPHT